MDCEWFRKIVYELAAGELPEEQAAAAAAHMESCPDCKREYESCLIIAKNLKLLGEAEAPAELSDNVMREISSVKKPSRINAVKFGSAAAAALLILAGTAAVNPLMKLRNENKNQANITESNEDVNKEDINNEKELEDGAFIAPEAETEKDFDAQTDSVKPAPREDAAPESAQASENTAPSTSGFAEAEKAPETKTEKSSKAARSSEPAETAPEKAADTAASENAKAQGGAEYGIEKTDSPEETIAMDNADEESFSGGAERDEAVSAEEPSQETKATSYVARGGGRALREEKESADEDSADSGLSEAFTSGGAAETYIKVIAEFTVPAEYAEAAANAETEGCSAAQVEERLNLLGVPYTLSVTEIDYTAEYSAADEERRAEIREMCASDICAITVKDEG